MMSHRVMCMVSINISIIKQQDDCCHRMMSHSVMCMVSINIDNGPNLLTLPKGIGMS